MKESGIVFTGESILSIREGQKTQTRRVMKYQPSETPEVFKASLNKFGTKPVTAAWWDGGICILPYGNVGDHLWVREAWRTESDAYNDLSPSQMSGEETILYDANGDWSNNKTVGRYRHARFMPRWASRILLEITGVRVERLQDISEADAKAEGVEYDHSEIDFIYWIGDYFGKTRTTESAVACYRILWGSIHGDGSWAANPYVWRISFQRVGA
jgi:hypothetical protein